MRFSPSFILFLMLFLSEFVIFSGISQSKKEKNQSWFLKAKVYGLPHSTVYLMSIYGHNQSIVDSTLVDTTGSFHFIFSTKNPTGMYSIVLGKTKEAEFYGRQPQSFNFIFNKENINLLTQFEHPTDSMSIIESEENKLYYTFLKKKNVFAKKLDILEQILNYYPETDDYIKYTKTHYNSLQKELNIYTNSLIDSNQSSFFKKIALLGIYPTLEPSFTEEKRLVKLKSNFFKPSDFEDSLLLHSSALSDKILSYFSLHRKQQITEAEQSMEFIKASDNILSLAKEGDSKVYTYILEYIIEGFTQIKQDAVLSYISDTYIEENSCSLDENKLLALKEKSSNYKLTAIGSIAPEIQINDTVKLSALDTDYTLLVFWASWCPHCRTQLPEINKVLTEFNETNNNSITTVAISLDTVDTEWKKYIFANSFLNWLHSSELKGWKGEIPKRYNVHATPTMLLLNRDKKIISKPITTFQLSQTLNKDGEETN